MKKFKISTAAAIAVYAMLAAVLFTSCTYKKEGKIVMDKEGNFYTLTQDDLTLMPSEAYRLKEIDTTKFTVRGFENCRITSKQLCVRAAF